MGQVALDLEADIRPVSEFRSNAAGLIKQTREGGRPVVITQRGRGAAVLVDIHRYQAMVDELEALRDVHDALDDVAAGREVDHGPARAALLDRYR